MKNDKVKKGLSTASLVTLLLMQSTPVLGLATTIVEGQDNIPNEKVKSKKDKNTSTSEDIKETDVPVTSSEVIGERSKEKESVESSEEVKTPEQPEEILPSESTEEPKPSETSEEPKPSVPSTEKPKPSQSVKPKPSESSKVKPSASSSKNKPKPSTSASKKTTGSSAEVKPKASTNNSKKESTSSNIKEEAPKKTYSQSQEIGPYITEGKKDLSLSSDLLVDSITKSNLNGYELPLLSSFSEKSQAAIVVEALKQLDKPYSAKDSDDDKGFNNLSLVNHVYKKVFDFDLGSDLATISQAGKHEDVKKAEAGDLLIWEATSQVAIYLGHDKFIMADDYAKYLSDEDKKDSKIESDEKSGVRIFTLNTFDKVEDKKTSIKDDKFVKPDYAISIDKTRKMTKDGEELVKNYAASANYSQNQETRDFIEKIGESARKLGQDYDVFASVMIAQAILESGSGSSQLASAPYNNLFGVKGGQGISSVVFSTLEDSGNGKMYSIKAPFRVYSSTDDSLKDYVTLLRKGIDGNSDHYKGAWRSEAKNYLQATNHLTGRYATDTQYSNKLNSIISVYNLTRFDTDSKNTGDSGVVIQDKNSIPAEYRSAMKFEAYNGRNYNVSGSYPVGQCTWYTYNRIKQLGGSVGETMGNGGVWGVTAMNNGYNVSSTPKAGTAISFKPGIAGADGFYGHVAFVEAVTPNGILISESNVVNDRTVSYRVLSNDVAKSSGVTYIEPK